MTRNLGLRLSTIVWFVLALALLLSLPVLMDASMWVVAGLIFLAMIIAAPLAWLCRHAFGLPGKWLHISLALWCLLCALAALPVYYLATMTEVRPALAPQVELRNGDKTVIFQGMMHVASENFYKAVIYDVEKALADGFVIYYEGVQTNTPESEEFFAQLSQVLTGGKDLAGVYTALGQTCGLKFQGDYFMLLEADKQEHPERHIIADVDALELKQEYDRLIKEDIPFASRYTGIFNQQKSNLDSDGSMAEMVEFLKAGTDGQKKLAGILCRGVMTMAYSPEAQQDQDAKLKELILDYRNQALVNRIASDENKLIFITYGARHLTGVVALLKDRDPAWTVQSVKWLRTIEAPKQFDAHLEL